MQIVLFDTPSTRASLYPFSSVRSIAEIRLGMYTQTERWQKAFPLSVIHLLSESYLNYDTLETTEQILYIDSSVIFTEELLQELKALRPGMGLKTASSIVAFQTDVVKTYGFDEVDCVGIRFTQTNTAVQKLQYPFEIIAHNSRMVQQDINGFLQSATSATLSSTNHVSNAASVFIEEGAEVEHALINASTGPVYIGKNVLVMEGTMIRGPVALLEGTVVKMGTKIYGAVTTGKQCTIGGEIKNSVFFDYSNKAHDGYLGDAVIGAWCNLGAGTSASNVKNTAGEIKLWNPLLHQWMAAGSKCGVMLGDYSRTAINTSLNTGTVAGVCCNILSERFPPKYIPHFTWNVADNERYVFSKAIEAIANWKQMKQQLLTERETEILQYIYNLNS
ncbi:MAG TPA: putative sugar nucleotidyl transferase [Lacibacter sp.]|nr:putative sugar nucleotidyl transferase [Lacibacter sp.]